jgi:hypothetical protein
MSELIKITQKQKDAILKNAEDISNQIELLKKSKDPVEIFTIIANIDVMAEFIKIEINR